MCVKNAIFGGCALYIYIYIIIIYVIICNNIYYYYITMYIHIIIIIYNDVNLIQYIIQLRMHCFYIHHLVHPFHDNYNCVYTEHR